MSDTKQLLRETRDRVAPPRDVLGSLQRRRERDTQIRRARAAVVGIAVALAVVVGLYAVQRDGEQRTANRELGIFAPVAGWIVYDDSDGLWAVDPAPSRDPMRVQLSSKRSTPVGWSSDGTELLMMRTVRGERVDNLPTMGLFILDADGTETQVTTEPMPISGATISPDGTRVVFTTYPTNGQQSRLYAVDADGGSPEILLEPKPRLVEGLDRPAMTEVYAPTFSPDGSQIAYVDGMVDFGHSVWVVEADGTRAHQIVNDQTTQGGFVVGLAWSPAGDKIALGLRHTPAASIYTFTPDGSAFTRVIEYGGSPSWSPDGSRIAYERYLDAHEETGDLVIADADGSNVDDFILYAGPGVWHPGR